MEGEVFVDTAEACNEVIFECADGTLSCILVVHAGRDELEVYICIGHKIFQHFRKFIVKALQFWVKSSVAQFGVQDFVGCEDCLLCLCL